MKKIYIKILIMLGLSALIIWRYHTPISQETVMMHNKKAIIIGASSGIGRALAHELSANGYQVGLTGRRIELLKPLQKELPVMSYVAALDVSNSKEAMRHLEDLIAQMGGLDLIIINAGTGYPDTSFNWEKQQQILDVNVIGFAAMANVAIRHFIQQKRGHLVGISSILALRGVKHSFTYSGSKAFQSNFMQGLRATMQAMQLPIYITNIEPGFVDTDMVKEVKEKIWTASPEKAAEQIYTVIKDKREHAYITKRWRLIAWFVRWSPDWLFSKIWK